MPDQSPAADQPSKWYVAIALALATFLAYLPARNNDFVHYDDYSYVRRNNHVQAGLTMASVRYAFQTFNMANWHPLTWLSLELDAQIYGGQNARGFHTTNILIHVANTVLLFFAFTRMTGMVWRSAFVAALFGLHPLHVESVAWVAERKDVLSTLFWMLALHGYISYAHRQAWVSYVLMLLALALGLLAKPMLVTFPCVLLLLDYWPLGRAQTRSWTWLGIEKIPLLVLVTASSIVTVVAQHAGLALATLDKIPFDQRVWNALCSYGEYIGKTFWPLRLAAFYQHPRDHVSITAAIATCVALVAMTGVAIAFARRRPYLPVGWFWYLGTLVPVIGIVQVGDQALADRYMYIPSIGLFLLYAWLAGDLLAALRVPGTIAALAAAAVLFACIGLTWVQAGYWHDDLSLWYHAVQVTRNNQLAHSDLGRAYDQRNRLDEALAQYDRAIAIDPKWVQPRYNRASLLHRMGRVKDSIAEYEEVIRLNSSFWAAHQNLAAIYREKGLNEKAEAEYKAAIDSSPEDPLPAFSLGTFYRDLGRLDEARQALALARRIDPNMVPAWAATADTETDAGDYRQALEHYRQALAMMSPVDPNHGLILSKFELAQRLEKTEQRLPEYLIGKVQPADSHERIELAKLCQLPRLGLYAAAAHFYGRAFADPGMPTNPRSNLRFLAACAAAQAGTGADRGTIRPDPKEQERLRAQALVWLKTDLALWSRLASDAQPSERKAAGEALRVTKQARALACVREPAELAKLPEKERAQWQKYWSDIDQAFAQAHEDRKQK